MIESVEKLTLQNTCYLPTELFVNHAELTPTPLLPREGKALRSRFAANTAGRGEFLLQNIEFEIQNTFRRKPFICPIQLGATGRTLIHQEF
jgi:hypothetical protein